MNNKTPIKIINWSIILFFFSLFNTAAQASDRVALVIGNSNYQSSPLRSPANDAQDTNSALSKLMVFIKFGVTNLELSG